MDRNKAANLIGIIGFLLLFLLGIIRPTSALLFKATNILGLTLIVISAIIYIRKKNID